MTFNQILPPRKLSAEKRIEIEAALIREVELQTQASSKRRPRLRGRSLVIAVISATGLLGAGAAVAASNPGLFWLAPKGPPTPSLAPNTRHYPDVYPPVDPRAATCAPGQVTITGITAQWSRASEEAGVMLVLGNNGSRACNLAGFPKAILRDAVGPMPFTYLDRGFSKPATARLVTLRPGRDSAQIVLARSTCVSGEGRTATEVTITLPGASSRTVLRVPPGSGLSTCKIPSEDFPPRIFIGSVQYLWPGSN